MEMLFGILFAIVILFSFHAMIEFDKEIKRQSVENYNETQKHNQGRGFRKNRFLARLFF